MDNIPYGYCHCGCGHRTDLAKKTRSEAGWVKGQPKRFIKGHNARKPIPSEPGPNRKNGFCECGCGNPAPIASSCNKAKGYVRGKPVRFLPGHATIKSQVDYLAQDRPPA